MNFAQNTALFFVFLLPGFFFYRGINSLSYPYISQGLISVRTPSVISLILLCALLTHGFFLPIIYLILFWIFKIDLLSLVTTINSFSIEYFQWLTIYTFSTSIVGYKAGVMIVEGDLWRKRPLLQIVKHKWITDLLKVTNYSKNTVSPLVKICVYTSEYFEYQTNDSDNNISKNIKSRVVYKGNLSDFFLSQDGKLEYLTLKYAKKTTELLMSEFPDSSKIWDDVSKKNNKGYLYIEGEKIFNVFIEPEKLSSKEEHRLSPFQMLTLILALQLLIAILISVTQNFKKNHSDLQADIQQNTDQKNANTQKANNFYEYNYLSIENNQSKSTNRNINRLLSTNGTYINVRTSPSKFAKIITNLHVKGSEITALKEIPENDKWYEVELSDGSIGYIFSDLLTEKSQ